jgi:hypothetical protein
MSIFSTRAKALSISRRAQFVVVERDRELRELADDVLRRMEQDAGMRFAEHRRVVVRIAGGDDGEVHLAEALDGLALLLGHAQVVIDDDAVGIDFQAVAEQRRPGQLAHQRVGEFVEGVGEDDHLVVLAQLVEEIRARRASGPSRRSPSGCPAGRDRARPGCRGGTSSACRSSARRASCAAIPECRCAPRTRSRFRGRGRLQGRGRRFHGKLPAKRPRRVLPRSRRPATRSSWSTTALSTPRNGARSR